MDIFRNGRCKSARAQYRFAAAEMANSDGRHGRQRYRNTSRQELLAVMALATGVALGKIKMVWGWPFRPLIDAYWPMTTG
jgi:hypothetical protein